MNEWKRLPDSPDWWLYSMRGTKDIYFIKERDGKLRPDGWGKPVEDLDPRWWLKVPEVPKETP